MSAGIDPTTAPFGEWVSPISAAMLAGGAHPVAGGRFVGSQVWWAEVRPDEGGRTAVRRPGADGSPEDVLGPPWNARTRVHEYGGGSWTATAEGALVFAEFTDQRLYRLDPGATEPVALTAAPATPGARRYGELSISADGARVWCVRESHLGESAGDAVTRDIVSVPIDGSAAEDDARITSVVGGSHFLAAARVSPDGRRLAWIAWEHPQMPWDGTELRVAELDPDGTCGPHRTLLGSSTESVLQPEWIDDDHLYALSDRSGWWNLYRVVAAGAGAAPEPLAPRSAEFGGPMWLLGTHWYAPLADGRILTVSTLGTDRLGLLDPGSGALRDLDLGDLTSLQLGDVRGSQVSVICGGARTPTGLRLIDLGTFDLNTTGAGAVTDVRLDEDDLPPAPYLSPAQPMTFTGPGGRDVHAIVYPPANPDFAPPPGARPPYVAFVHGGPTSQRKPRLALDIAYLTSRGVGVVDVNYGGSTGYGREYRERLRGQWGVVDVEDTVAVVRGLVDAGLADPARLAIQGGSAGGWTVLSALTQTDVFGCGISYYGVADLLLLAADTHDFESRYLDGLVGPLPQARALYVQRAPLNNAGGLSCPILLLQGLDDPVVPPNQAELFRAVLEAKGIRHAYRAYAGESHGFRRVETVIDATEAGLSFLGQIMDFVPPGIAVIELWHP